MSSRTIQTVRLKQIHREGAISEREDVHKKAFTKWLNSHLSKANPPVKILNLISDLTDGSVWLSLFDVLLNTKTERSTGHTYVHNINNLQSALEICKENQIKIDGINASDIAEGNSKTILGLLWNIIVHFQMKGTLKTDSKEYSIEKTLQSWCLSKLEKYKDFIQVKDFSKSWRDGKALNALLHSYKPNLFDLSLVMKMDNFSRLEHAFTMASLEWNVPRLLEPIDIDVEKPDKKMITMYLTCLFERLESSDSSRDITVSQSQPEVTSTSSSLTSHEYVTTASHDGNVTRKQAAPKAFFLRKKSSSSDKSDSSSQSDTADFPAVLIEEKKTILLSSVSSDISSSSSSAEPLSPTSPKSTSSLEQHERDIDVMTTTELEAVPESDLLGRVKHSEMYTFSTISDEEASPVLSRRFKPVEASSPLSGDTDSDSTNTSTDTVIHVETTTIGGTTMTTTTTSRKILQTATQGSTVVSSIQGEEPGDVESTTTTVIRETYVVEMPGESTKKTTFKSSSFRDQPSGGREVIDKMSSECESLLEMSEATSQDQSIHVKEDQNKILEDKLTDAAIAISDLEPRVKQRDSDVDVKALIKDREQLQFKINQVLLSGRRMVLDKVLDSDKELLFIEKLDKLERRMKLIMLWPIRDLRSISNYNKLLDDKLKLVEAAVLHLEPRIKKSVITRDVKALMKEREDLELKTIVVFNLGRDLIKDKQIDQDKEKDFIKRMDEIETKTNLIMMWPIRELSKMAFSSTSNYNKFLKDKLGEAESAVSHIEPRIKTSYLNKDNTDLIKERSKLYLFVQGAVGLGQSMIEHRLLNRKENKECLQRMEELEQRTNVIMAWPIREVNSTSTHDSFLNDQFEDVEAAASNIEPRLKESVRGGDNTALIKERDELEIKITVTDSLMRGMIDKGLVEKEKGYVQRMARLEQRMKMIKLWPLKEFTSGQESTKFLDDQLHEVEKEMLELEPCVRKKNMNESEIKDLNKECEDLKVRVHGLVSVGRGMIEDKLIDKDKEEGFTKRMKDLESRMDTILAWPIRRLSGNTNYNSYLEKKIEEFDNAVSNIEPRIRQSIANIDNTALIKERDILEVGVYGVVRLGRGMIEDQLIDKKKENDFKDKLNKLEKKTRLMMMWPIAGSTSSRDRDEFLDKTLHDTETEVKNFEQRMRKKDLSQAAIESLNGERDELEVRVYGVVSLGRGMIEDKLIDKKKEKNYQQGIDDVDRKMKVLMNWPIRMISGDEDYDKYFEDKLEKDEKGVSDIEPRIKKSYTNKDNKALMSECKELETKVYGTVTLGRGMIDDLLFSSKKASEFERRIEKVERKMRMLTMWPIREKSSSTDHDKYLDEKLHEVESAVRNFEPRMRKKDLSSADIKSLNGERDELEVKVYGVVSLGRGMIEDKLIDKKKEKNYQQGIDDVDRKMKVLMTWPIRKISGDEDYDKYFEDKLEKVEKGVSDIEPRIKKSYTNKDNKALMSECKELETKVYGTVSLGRGMIDDLLFSSKKASEFERRIEKVERKMRMLTMWPIREKGSSTDHDKYLDEKLHEVESAVRNFEPRMRKKDLSSADIKSLNGERDELEVKVYGVVSLGRGMIEDKLIDKKKEKNYQQRIDDVDRKMKVLMTWPIRKISGDEDYDKYFEDKLEKVEKGVSDIEPRIKKSYTNKDNKALMSECKELETKVYGTVSLGRGMIDDLLFSSKKASEFEQRIEKLGRKMKMLTMWPIREKGSSTDHDKYLDEKLHEVESAVRNFEPRMRKKDLSSADIKSLNGERDELEVKVYGVVSLGRGMIEDKLIDKKKEKNYQQGIDDVDRKMKVLMTWPIRKISGDEDYDKYFEDKLEKVEKGVSDIEPRIKKSYTNKDNKALMSECKELETKVYGTVSLGRGMIDDLLFSSKKASEFERRIEKVERKMRMLTMWPIREKGSSTDHDKYLDEKLHEVESAVRNFEPRMRKKDLSSADIKSLNGERDELEVKVYGVVSLGRGMIEDKLIDKKKEKNYQQRIDDVDRKMKVLMTWPIRKISGDEDYDKYFEDKLEKVEKGVSDIEPRIKKSYTNKDNEDLMIECKELETKVYITVSLGRGMIEDLLFSSKKEREFEQRIEKLERKMKMLMMWPIRKKSNSTDHDKFLDEKLHEVESAVRNFEPRMRKKDLSSADIKSLNDERDELEVKVYGVVSLGRGMIEDKLIDKKKEKNYKQRIDDVDRKMKVLMTWPIRKISGNEEYDKYFENKLEKIEKGVSDIEPRIKKSYTNKDNKALMSECKELETKVYGIVSLGRGMIEDLLFSSKKEREFEQRIEELERKMAGIIAEIGSSSFEEKLLEVEKAVLELEPRVMQTDLNEPDVEHLVKERDDLEQKAYGVLQLGRGMVEDKRFDEEKEQDYVPRMDDLEYRIIMLKQWPDNEQHGKPKSKRCKEFDDNLRRMEITLSEFEQRAKVNDRESIDLKSAKKSLDDIKVLVHERDQIEQDLFGLLNELRQTIKDEEFDPQDKAFYKRRMDRLEEKARVLKEWLQKELQRLFNVYIILIKQHLERLQDWLIRAEVRMDLEDGIGPTREVVFKQYDEHLEFHKEVGAYSTINMILEIDIDDPAIDDGLRQDIKTLSERWAAVWNWSEERKKRLIDVIEDWEKYREDEMELFDWLCDKEDTMRLIDTTDISDGEEVESHRQILKSLINEMKTQEYRLHTFQESGEILIADAQYHNEKAKPIRDEMNDFQECWRGTVERAQNRKTQLKESRQKFLQLAELKKEIKDWLGEAESLLSTANEERNKEEEQKYMNKIQIKCEERDSKQEHMSKINDLTKQLSPSIEKESAKDLNQVVKPLNRRWQDTSDKLDQCKDHERPLFHEECCLVTYIKNGFNAIKREKEARFK